MQPTKPLRRPKCGFFRVQSLPSPSIAVVEVEIVNKKKVIVNIMRRYIILRREFEKVFNFPQTTKDYQ